MEIQEAIEATQQPRSRYQLVHFVLGQHDTPEQQFRQLCLELQSIRRNIKSALLIEKKGKLKVARLLETGDEIDAVDAEIILSDMEEANVVMLGAYRELAVLEDLFNSIPHFTLDEIEHGQDEYWQLRLTRQTNLQIMAGGVGWAQLDAMRQANLLDGAIEERHEYLQSIAEAEAAQELEAGA